MIHCTDNPHHEPWPWPCSVLPRNLSGEPLQAEEKLNMSKFQSLIRWRGMKDDQTNLSLKITDLKAVFHFLWDRHHLGIWKHPAVDLLYKNACPYGICHGPQSWALLAFSHSLQHKGIKNRHSSPADNKQSPTVPLIKSQTVPTLSLHSHNLWTKKMIFIWI